MIHFSDASMDRSEVFIIYVRDSEVQFISSKSPVIKEILLPTLHGLAVLKNMALSNLKCDAHASTTLLNFSFPPRGHHL